MTDRTVAITGANRGVGLALVERYLAMGDDVFAFCRHPDGADELRALGPVMIEPLDLGDENSIDAAAAALTAGLGGRGLDLLLNNAGADGRSFGADPDKRGVRDLDPDHFMAQTRVNALGPLLLTRRLLDPIRAADQPVVVNVSSQLGSPAVASTIGGDAGYCASKASLNIVTVKFAQLLAPDNACVIAMHPGWLQSDMGGERAPTSVDEGVAAMVQTIETLTPADNGRFLRNDGSTHPW